jgi:preprotein translocase subunit SecG
VVFVVLAIILAAVAVDATTGREIDDSLNRTVVPATDPLAPVAQPGAGLNQPVVPAPAENAPAQAAPATDDPLAGVAE